MWCYAKFWMEEGKELSNGYAITIIGDLEVEIMLLY